MGLLSDQHDVTLYERDDRFGGHANTLIVDDEGTAVPVEAGFEFFSGKMWPTFSKLLGAMRVEARDYQARVAVYRTDESATRIMQPMDVHGRLSWRLLTPARAADLAQFALVLASVTPLMLARDTSVTFEQAISRVPLSKSFRDDFLFPFLLSGWCVEPDEYRTFSAYNALRNAYMGLSPRGAIAMREVVGGLASYVKALLAQCPRLTRA